MRPVAADLVIRVLLGCGVTWGCAVNSVRHERAAEGVKHVHGGWVGLGGVPRCVSAELRDLRFRVGVAGVPQDDDRLGHECERDAALNCFFDSVLGFADSGDVFAVVEADFDGPAGRVAGDDLGGGRGRVGGDDRDVVAFSGGGFSVAVLDQDDADRVGAPDPNQRPVISQVCAVMVVPYRLIRVSTQVLFLVAWLAMSVGVPMRAPRSLGRPRFPLAAGVGW